MLIFTTRRRNWEKKSIPVRFTIYIALEYTSKHVIVKKFNSFRPMLRESEKQLQKCVYILQSPSTFSAVRVYLLRSFIIIIFISVTRREKKTLFAVFQVN